jgi:hypothetical protein
MTPLEGDELSICREVCETRARERASVPHLRMLREQMNGQQIDVSSDEDGEGDVDLAAIGRMRENNFAARGACVNLPVPLVSRHRLLVTGHQLSPGDQILSLKPRES